MNFWPKRPTLVQLGPILRMDGWMASRLYDEDDRYLGIEIRFEMPPTWVDRVRARLGMRTRKRWGRGMIPRGSQGDFATQVCEQIRRSASEAS